MFRALKLKKKVNMDMMEMLRKEIEIKRWEEIVANNQSMINTIKMIFNVRMMMRQVMMICKFHMLMIIYGKEIIEAEMEVALVPLKPVVEEDKAKVVQNLPLTLRKEIEILINTRSNR